MAEAGSAVSRETRGRLDILVRELRAWQRVVNLVASASLDDVERRHIADSLQLVDLAPAVGAWVDLGSGGGFPGLVIAAAAPARHVVLIESDSRKCAFLRHAAAAMGISAVVRAGRIEAELESACFEAWRRQAPHEEVGGLQLPHAEVLSPRDSLEAPTTDRQKLAEVSVVSARALAPLTRLIGYAQPLLARGAIGLFPKGRAFASELTAAREHWHFDVDVIASRTDSDGRVLRISGFEGRRG